MKNRDMPAVEKGGLTKREQAAIAAMQGLLAGFVDPVSMGNLSEKTGVEPEVAIAMMAQKFADALFDELEKGD